MKWLARQFAAACCLMGVLTLNASAPYAQGNEEYALKAAYIYNFLKFVEWPGEKAVSKHSSVNICVIGDSDLMQTGAIFAAAKGSTKPVLVQEKSAASAARHCHIIFFSKSEDTKISSQLAVLENKPVLTVSDIDDFAERGGMIGFVMYNDKPKLVINPRAASAVGLRIDAQLLEVALKVMDR